MGIVSTVVEYSGIDPEKAIRKGSMDIDAGLTHKHANYTVENMHWQNDTTGRSFIFYLYKYSQKRILRSLHSILY